MAGFASPAETFNVTSSLRGHAFSLDLDLGLGLGSSAGTENLGLGVDPLSPPPSLVAATTVSSLGKCGGEMTLAYENTWSGFKYWCEGVLTCVVGVIGFIGNILSIAVLSTR